MESDSSPVGQNSRPSGAQAHQALHDLELDRATLAERLAAPGWLHPLFALVVAAFVATPAIRVDEARNTIVGLLIAVTFVLLATYQRLCGVRVGRTGIRGAALVIGVLAATLLLLSTSYGLVSLLTGWWVLAPAAACFVMVLAAGRWLDRLYREELRRGR